MLRSFQNGNGAYVAKLKIFKIKDYRTLVTELMQPKEKRIRYEAKPGETPKEFVERIKKTEQRTDY